MQAASTSAKKVSSSRADARDTTLRSFRRYVPSWCTNGSLISFVFVFLFYIPGRCIERAIVDVLSSEDRRRNKEGKEGVEK